MFADDPSVLVTHFVGPARSLVGVALQRGPGDHTRLLVASGLRAAP